MANFFTVRDLDLRQLGSGTVGCITPLYGGMLAECGAVCLEDQRHASGAAILHVDGSVQAQYRLHFSPVTGQMRRCHHDEQPTTEHGAYGIAILLVHHHTELTVVERSRKGTGFDYWLGTGEGELFDRAARLEVSGTRSGGPRELERRTRQKVEQTTVSDDMKLPAYVVVVEFSAPHGRFLER
jgi:hypothetical protein